MQIAPEIYCHRNCANEPPQNAVGVIGAQVEDLGLQRNIYPKGNAGKEERQLCRLGLLLFQEPEPQPVSRQQRNYARGKTEQLAHVVPVLRNEQEKPQRHQQSRQSAQNKTAALVPGSRLVKLVPLLQNLRLRFRNHAVFHPEVDLGAEFGRTGKHRRRHGQQQQQYSTCQIYTKGSEKGEGWFWADL